MGTLPESVTGPVVFEAEGDPLPALEDALRRHGRATLLGRRLREDKLEGVTPERVDALAAAGRPGPGGGGRRARPLAQGCRPATSRWCRARRQLLLVVAALDVLGAPLDESWVHRLELVGDACGRARGEPLGPRERGACLGRRRRLSRARSRRASAPASSSTRRRTRRRAPRPRTSPRGCCPYAFVAAGSARAGECRLLAPDAATRLSTPLVICYADAVRDVLEAALRAEQRASPRRS